MRTCRGTITLAIFVSAVAAAALEAAPRAQETARPAPRPDRPNAATQDIVRERVRTTPASVLDSALPPLAFDDWLFATLAPLMDVPWQPPSAWRVRFCDDREFPIPEGGRELCVDASVRVTADKAVHIIVAADEPAVGSDDRVRWRSIRLNVRDVGVGQSIRLEFDALLQAGRATAVVTVEPAASTKVIRESQPRKDPAFMIVSVPTWRRQ